jgi:EmrB/QacA subfamily drug resistance transporter
MRPTDQEQACYAWRVLSVTALGVILCFVNASTLTVALPVVAQDLGASPMQASWVLLSYMLVMTVLIPVFGRLADLFGRRTLYMAGLATLTLASLGCSLATRPETLLVFRCLQAVGAAAVITNTSALIADAFPLRMLGMGMGLNSTISAAAQSFGPMLGGAVVSTLGWRAIFWLNLPIGMYALYRAHRILRRTPRERHERFDLVGAVLSMIGLGGLVYGLSMTGPLGWSSPQVLWGAAAAVVGLSAFVASQLVRRDPLIDMTLFADRERATAYASVLLICMAQTSSVLLVALFIQGVQGQNAFQAGLGVAPVPLGMMIASPIVGRLTGRFTSLAMSTFGLLLVMAGLALLAWLLQPQIPSIQLGMALLLIGLGTGCFLTSNNSGIMASVAPRRRGVANAVRSTLQNTGLVVGAAMSTSIAISQLSPASQRAVYEGTLSQAASADIFLFVAGCRLAFVLLAGVCLSGIALSLLTRHALRAQRVDQPA